MSRIEKRLEFIKKYLETHRFMWKDIVKDMPSMVHNCDILIDEINHIFEEKDWIKVDKEKE